jgi:hypothetical protein
MQGMLQTAAGHKRRQAGVYADTQSRAWQPTAQVQVASTGQLACISMVTCTYNCDRPTMWR